MNSNDDTYPAMAGGRADGTPAGSARGNDSLLDLIVREGRRKWPEVRVTTDQLAAQIPRSSLAPHEEPRHCADVYLAWACLAGDAGAISQLEELCGEEVGFAARHVQGPVNVRELAGDLMTKLLVRAEGGAAPPKLSQYRGSSELRRWLQIAASRELLDRRRRNWREEPLDRAVQDRLIDPDTPEIRCLDAGSKDVFKTALAEVLKSLAPRERNLLRHQLEGLTLTEIAALYNVRHNTVSRWLAQVRANIDTGTRRALLGRLRKDTVDSLVRSILHRLDSSICAVLIDGCSSDQGST